MNRIKEGELSALGTYAVKAFEYLQKHKTADKNRLSKVLGVGVRTVERTMRHLGRIVKLWAVQPGKNGKGGGWEIAGDSVSEL